MNQTWTVQISFPRILGFLLDLGGLFFWLAFARFVVKLAQTIRAVRHAKNVLDEIRKSE